MLQWIFQCRNIELVKNQMIKNTVLFWNKVLFVHEFVLVQLLQGQQKDPIKWL